MDMSTLPLVWFTYASLFSRSESFEITRAFRTPYRLALGFWCCGINVSYKLKLAGASHNLVYKGKSFYVCPFKIGKKNICNGSIINSYQRISNDPAYLSRSQTIRPIYLNLKRLGLPICKVIFQCNSCLYWIGIPKSLSLRALFDIA